jgi:hypothetical protein
MPTSRWCCARWLESWRCTERRRSRSTPDVGIAIPEIDITTLVSGIPDAIPEIGITVMFPRSVDITVMFRAPTASPLPRGYWPSKTAGEGGPHRPRRKSSAIVRSLKSVNSPASKKVPRHTGQDSTQMCGLAASTIRIIKAPSIGQNTLG